MGQQVPKSNIPNYERREQALALRTAGLTYMQIGKALGIGFSRARKLVIAAIKERQKRCDELADEVIRIELERLDSIWFSLWPQKGDPRTAEVLLRVQERRARLLGLDAAQKHEISGKDGGPISIEDTRARNLELIESLSGRVAREADASATSEADRVPDAGTGATVSLGLEGVVGPTEPTGTTG